MGNSVIPSSPVDEGILLSFLARQYKYRIIAKLHVISDRMFSTHHCFKPACTWLFGNSASTCIERISQDSYTANVLNPSLPPNQHVPGQVWHIRVWQKIQWQKQANMFEETQTLQNRPGREHQSFTHLIPIRKLTEAIDNLKQNWISRKELIPSEKETPPVFPFVQKSHLQKLSDLILLDNICMNAQNSANRVKAKQQSLVA